MEDIGNDQPTEPTVQHAVESPSEKRKGDGGVLEVGIDGFFNARHYLLKDGEPGPTEMKSWRVEISLKGAQFDESGQLSGIDVFREAVKKLLAAYNNKLLNNLKPYQETQPTPENIARVLYDQIKTLIAEQPLRLKGIKVWASPTQYVWYSGPPSHAA